MTSMRGDIYRLLRGILALLALGLPMGSFGSPARAFAALEIVSIPVPARSIGPAVMGGRITEIAIDPTNSSRWVVATASSGLWITENAGASWVTPFDKQAVSALGAVALNPKNPKEIWVGTGEPNARNSVSQGDGVYWSGDGGQTWLHRGLKSSRHIGRIVVDPRDPRRVFVAALGPLWSEGGDRGLFRSEDSGQSWRQVLPIPADVGVVDVQLDPHNSDRVVACAYRVRRGPFSGGNPREQLADEAGIYLSVDAGNTFKKVAHGLPEGLYGRCGIDFDRNKKGRVLAVIQTGETATASVTDQLPNGNEPGPAGTGGVFESLDAGESWGKLNDLCPRPFYFGQVRTDPSDSKRVWVLGIPLYRSTDHGKTFRSDIGFGVHPDHHALVFDPKDPRSLLLGTDGGLYSSKDGGKTWTHINNMVLAQYYGVDVDERSPFRVMGGLQDNGTWIGPSRTGRSEGILPSDWSRLYGADGFQAKQDPQTAHIAYLESQYGGLRRHDFRAGLSIDIRPRPAEGDPALRFEWNAPLLLSRHTPNTVYYGANYLFRSEAKGANWKKISPDLTRGTPGPDEQSGHNLTALGEDCVDADLLWAGSDDGLLHVTTDQGKSWSEVGRFLPLISPGWIRAICPLKPRYIPGEKPGKGSALVAVDRHRLGDDRPYLFQTFDQGKTWKDLSSGLAGAGCIHAVLEHPLYPGIWWVGTETGLWCSIHGGSDFFRVGSLPTVPVHGLVVSRKTGELVVATHGRGIWVLDPSFVVHVARFGFPKGFTLLDIPPFERLSPQKMVTIDRSKDFIGQNPLPGAVIGVYIPGGTEPGTGAPLGQEKAKVPRIKILDPSGKTVATIQESKGPGFQQYSWAVPSLGKPVAGAGESGPANAPGPAKPLVTGANGVASPDGAKKQKETIFRIIAELDGKVVEKPLIVREKP